MTHLLTVALVLQLHNFAGAPPAVVQAAQREVTRVYADIGVPIEWDGSTRQADQTAVRVILVAREPRETPGTPRSVMGAAMWTDTGTAAVYVFYRRIEAEALRYDVSTALVLACALAHELGHVLLPEEAHSPEGLMRAAWNRDDFHRADRGQLRFLPGQAARIRARITTDD
jgi:hypothetical protein